MAAAAPERRAAQTVMYIVADGLTRLMAPILPVTADELWQHLPGRREESVHLALFPAGLEALLDEAAISRWTRLIRLRDAVNVEIEKLRQQKVIGTALAAKVPLEPRGALVDLVAGSRDHLPTLFITSQVDVVLPGEATRSVTGPVVHADYAESEDSGARILVSRADGVKCERCWRYVPDVSQSPTHEGICGRCEAALAPPV
jgi:isoleucyl-tRNA synthetase